MPDFHSDNAVWLERELARQLAPVAAPDSLWHRIDRQQRKRQRTVSLEWVFWPVTFAMIALAFAGTLRTLAGRYNPDRITDRELAALAERSPQGFDFQSDSFEDTRAWVKAETNIDIDLPSGPRGDRRDVQLLGTRVLHLRGLPIAAIDYRIGDETATLFVSGKRSGLNGNTEGSKHLFSRIVSTGHARVFSWNMRNQIYTIAFTGVKNPQGACLVCHVNTPMDVF